MNKIKNRNILLIVFIALLSFNIYGCNDSDRWYKYKLKCGNDEQIIYSRSSHPVGDYYYDKNWNKMYGVFHSLYEGRCSLTSLGYFTNE